MPDKTVTWRGKQYSWYNIIVSLVMTTVTCLFGSLIYTSYRRRASAAPERDANAELASTRIAPALRRVINNYPDKEVSVLLEVRDAPGQHPLYRYTDTMTAFDNRNIEPRRVA